jgi:hypothetical protein
MYAQAAPGKPVDPRTVMLIGAVFFFSLTGASIAAIFATRRDGGRDLSGTESEASLALTPRQARRMSRQFAQAGVHISPSRLRAINAGAEASDTELVDIEFGLIATDPHQDSLLNSDLNRRAQRP